MQEYYDQDAIASEVGEQYVLFLKHFIEKKDLDQLKQFFPENAVGIGSLNKVGFSGPEQILALLKYNISLLPWPVMFDEKFRKIKVTSSDSALLSGSIDLITNDERSESPLHQPQNIKLTLLWKKLREKWFIEYMHSSEISSGFSGKIREERIPEGQDIKTEKKLTRELWKTRIELSELEKENNESQQLFQSICEKISDGIILADPEKKSFTYVNESICELLKYKKPQLLSLWLKDILLSDTDTITDLINRGIGEENKKFNDTPFICSNKEIKYFDISAKEVTFLNKKHVLFICEDISEQKKALAIMKDAELAQKASESKNLFLANMSHEIRTPVTGIIGMSEILANTKLDTQQADYLQIINESSRILLRLINDILDIAKIEAGKIHLSYEPFSLQNIIQNIKKLNHPELINKNNKLKVIIDSEIPETVISDKLRIEQVIMNLLNNAMKFTENGQITIDVIIADKSKPDTIKISVSDTGPGISKEDQNKLFNIFQQIENTRSEGGSGLGLYICKHLISYMGGEIGVESKPDKGSTFWFTFDSKPEKQDLDIINEDDEEEDDDIEVSLGLKILLVDDKNVNIQVISLMLEAADCSVDIAKNGIEAIEVFTPDKYDVILMDIMMPVMDGVTAMKELKKKYDKTPPIIAITANAMAGDKEKYMKEGFDGYIAKPVTTRKLVSELLELNIIVKNEV